ncbi:hypothetical protein EDC96DRAFT_542560 [Choanephora cucurbitarum]|nr:hypothetical protein EDC96DRAFT_542560 [Choanephora cucurbitarum]
MYLCLMVFSEECDCDGGRLTVTMLADSRSPSFMITGQLSLPVSILLTLSSFLIQVLMVSSHTTASHLGRGVRISLILCSETVNEYTSFFRGLDCVAHLIHIRGLVIAISGLCFSV